MEWILQLHPPPYHPSLDGMLVHQSLPTSMLPLNTKFKTCVCVCWRRGGGGVGNVKQNSFLQKKIKWWNRIRPLSPPSPIQCLMWWLSLHQDLEKLVKPQILQLEVEDSKKNRSLLDKHYFKTTNRWSIFWLTSNSLDITGILKTF